MTATQIRSAGLLSPLVDGIRTAVARHAGWEETAQLSPTSYAGTSRPQTS